MRQVPAFWNAFEQGTDLCGGLIAPGTLARPGAGSPIAAHRGRPVCRGSDPTAPTLSPSPDQAACDSWCFESTLPPGQRAAFVLHKVEGRPYREVAAALGCSEEAARSRVAEAMKKVKEATR